MVSELIKYSLSELRELIDQKKISVTELTKAYLEQIKKVDSKVNSYLTLCEELSLAKAKECDKKIAQGEKLGILGGIPLAPKDIYLTKGIRTTCASKILENYIPPYNSEVIDRCLNADSIILGKVNLDEFAMGSSTENSAFMSTKNPWDLERVPGGSSGGSAAVVASLCAVASLGTDTGGSIRQPASLCGVVGLKPTYGRVSRFGTIAFASSLDQMGPITKNVKDTAIMMNVMAGHDVKDSTSVDIAVPDYTKNLNDSIKGLKIGIPKEYFSDQIQPEVSTAIKKALAQLEEMGAIVEEVSLPHTEYAPSAYYIIAPAEASSNLARYDGIRYGLREKANTLEALYRKSKTKGFGPEVKRRIMLGTYVLSAGYYDAYYGKAQKIRTVIRKDFLEAFRQVDVIMTPTSPTTAFKIGEKTKNPIEMYLSDIFTIAINLAGLPGMSLPCGFDNHNLPIGLQIIGKPFDETTLLKVAHNYEQANLWYKKFPSL